MSDINEIPSSLKVKEGTDPCLLVLQPDPLHWNLAALPSLRMLAEGGAQVHWLVHARHAADLTRLCPAVQVYSLPGSHAGLHPASEGAKGKKTREEPELEIVVEKLMAGFEALQPDHVVCLSMSDRASRLQWKLVSRLQGHKPVAERGFSRHADGALRPLDGAATYVLSHLGCGNALSRREVMAGLLGLDVAPPTTKGSETRRLTVDVRAAGGDLVRLSSWIHKILTTAPHVDLRVLGTESPALTELAARFDHPQLQTQSVSQLEDLQASLQSTDVLISQNPVWVQLAELVGLRCVLTASDKQNLGEDMPRIPGTVGFAHLPSPDELVQAVFGASPGDILGNGAAVVDPRGDLILHFESSTRRTWSLIQALHWGETTDLTFSAREERAILEIRELLRIAMDLIPQALRPGKSQLTLILEQVDETIRAVGRVCPSVAAICDWYRGQMSAVECGEPAEVAAEQLKTTERCLRTLETLLGKIQEGDIHDMVDTIGAKRIS